MTGMVTNKLRQVVEGFVSNYVIFDDSKVSSTPLSWTFKDTEFQPDLLHKVDITSDLPIYVKASHVGHIRISSTWTFRIEKIEVSDVVIIAVPNSKEHNAKQMDTYCDNLFYKLEQAGSWKEYLTPFVSTYVMKGLDVTVSNIRFRYEEMQPACSCVEIGIEQVKLLYSADDAQDIQIDGFSVHIHSEVPQDGYWMNLSDWKANWKQRREPLSEVVADVSIHVTRSPLEDPNSGKFDIAVKSTSKKSSSEIDVLVRPTQLRSLLAIFDTWRFLLVREVYWAHRPPSHIRPRGVHCRAWWRYAFNVIRETKLFPFKFERIKRYRRFYAEYIHNFKVLNGPDETKAMEALNTLRQLSKVLNRTSIVLAREEAFAQLELEPQEDMSPDFERSGQVGVLKMAAKLPDIRLCLCDEIGGRLHGVISGLRLKYKNTPLEALTKLSLALDDALVEFNWKTEPHAPDNWIPILSSVESDKRQLMKVVLESRQTAIASQTVKMSVRPTRAHVYQPTISCITAAASKMTGAGNGTITQASIAYTSQLMSAVFPSSSIMSWDLDVCNPQVILPEWGPMEKDGALLYFDLGHLKSTSNAPDVKTADDVLGINVARVENIQVIFAESGSKLKSILKKESEGFFMVPSSIDVELQNLSSGRQRLQLGVAPVDLQIDRLNDIVRVLANAGFLRRAKSSQRSSSGPLKTKFQRALELQLWRALRSDSNMAEMRGLARDLRLSRMQRSKSRKKAQANNVYTDLVLLASSKSPPVNSGVKTLSSSPVLQAGYVRELATERNPLRWELGVAVQRMKLEVKMEGCMALTCSQMKVECGKMEYGLCGMFEVGDVDCVWHSRGRQINLLRRGGVSGKESVCQIVFVDLQPNCPRFHSDYGAVRTSIAARFGSLAAHVDQAAIIDIMDTTKNFTEQLDEYISEVPESVDLLSKEISRAVNGLIAQNDDMEEEMLRRQSSVIRYHTLTKIGTLSLDLTMGTHRKPVNFAHVYMKQLQIETRVHRNWSRYKCELEDCWIEHRRQRANYRRILERTKTHGVDKHKDLKLLSCTIHRHFRSPNPNDCDTASLTMNRVDIVCLPEFVKDMQAFVGRFGRQLAIYSRRVGQRARDEIVNISKSSFRLELTLFMPSPRFLIPIGVDSEEMFTLQLGDLRVKTDDPERGDSSQPSCDRFKVGLESVKFTRAVMNNGKIISCSDIFDSEELAGISLSRDPVHKVLEMTVTTYLVQPIISPRDYHNLLTVINSWKALGAAPRRVSVSDLLEDPYGLYRMDFERKPEIDVVEESEAVWTFAGTAHVKGIILDIMDCRSVASCVYDQDLVPIGRLEMSDLDIKLMIDSKGDYSLTSNWNGLSLDDMRETEIARPNRLISICKETAKLKYESHGNDNIVFLSLTDMKIYADIIYFRNLVKMFESPEDLVVPEDEQLARVSQRPQSSSPSEPWTSGSWKVEVCGANLILHCLSEVEVKENSDHRFMDVQLTVHQKHSDGIVRPWKFTHDAEESRLEVALFVGIDFGYINSLFCHILDSTCIDFIWTKDRWQEECQLTLRRRQEIGEEDKQHIGLILSPLLMLHVQRIAQTFISPVSVVRSRIVSSTSSSCSASSPHMKRLVTTGTLPRRSDTTDDPSTSAPMAIDTKEFNINDASENSWLIAPDKLPAVKQFPSEPLDWAQRLTLDCDPVNIHFHMNVDDPILRLDIDIDKFEIDDWQAEVNVRVQNFQISVWSFNDDEQQWEALVEKLANEDVGVPFVADRPDSFRMWSCDVNLSMRGTRVLGDQTLPELMEDLQYHGERIKLDSLTVDHGALEGDDDQLQEGSIENLARALKSQTCYFLQIVSNRQNGERSEPLLINYSPSTARRLSEIMECLTSIQEGTPAHPDKRLIPTLRIINDTGSEMTVAAETEGQLVEPINCTLTDALTLMDDSLQTTSSRNSYHLGLKIKGYNPVRCEVGRHSRISTRRLIPSQDSSIQSSVEPDFLLVQTETDLALATVRFTSRYFIENRLELPLLAYIRDDGSYEKIPAKETHALPLCTKDNIKINMEGENYKPIDCNLIHAIHREHLQLVSKDEKSEPTCNFMKTIAIDGMKVTLTFDAFIRINNFLPCTVEIAFQDSKRDKVEICRGKHAFLPMFAQTDSLNLIITVNNYQNSRWRCEYVMKTSSSKKVKRLRLDEVPSGTLVRQSYRTGRFICIASRRTDESDCRIMNLFAPLWIMNDKTNISWHIKERNCPYVVVTPGDEPALLTPRLIASSSNWHKCLIKMCGITEAIDDGTMTPRWSRNIDVGAVCKTVALTIPRTQKLNQGHRMTDGWMLLLKIEQLPFTYSRLVTILPCYILQNRTHHRIVFVEDREDSTPEEYVIPINQTIPFWPRGDSLKARVRREDGSRFSKPFAFNETQSTALKVSDEWAVTVEVSGGIDLKPRAIRFRRYRRGDAPLRIENLCASRNVRLQQIGGRATVLPEFKYTVYLWDNPCGLRQLTCAVVGECVRECVCQTEFEVPVNSNNGACIKCERGDIYWISFIHENQRTLLVTDKKAVYQRVQSLSQAEPMRLWAQLRLDEVGVSFISNRREIAFLSVSGMAKSRHIRFPGLFLMYQGADKNRLIHLRVSQFRLFNSLWRPIYREVLYDRPDEDKPFLDFGVKWRIADAKCGQAIDMLRIKLSSIIANVDYGFAMTVYGAFIAPNESMDEMPVSDIEIVEEGDLKETELNIKRQTLMDIVNTNVGEQEQEYLFRDAVMEDFKLRLSLSGDGKVHGAYEPSVRAYSILAPLVGSIFSQKDTLLTMSQFQRSGLSMPVKNFVNEVLAHLKSNLTRQVYMLLLGIDIFGDPITVYHTVTEGFRDEIISTSDNEEEEAEEHDESEEEDAVDLLPGADTESVFHQESRQEDTESRPRRRSRRRRRGVRASLVPRRGRVSRVVRHVGGGVAHSVAQFTRAMGRIVSKATFDPMYIQERRERFHRAIEPSDCGREAAISFIKGIGAGTFGIVYRPIKGARKSGFGGGLRGLGRGMIGIPTRPIAGTLDAASLGAEGLKRLALHEHFPYPEGRRPRACANKTFSYFSEWEAFGQKILFSIDEDKYTITKGNRYRAHVLIGSKKRKAIFVTDTMIIKAKKVFDYKWRTCWTISLDFIRALESGEVSNPKASNEIQRVLIVKHGKNEGDNRTKRIFLPEDKCHQLSRGYLKAAIEKAKREIPSSSKHIK